MEKGLLLCTVRGRLTPALQTHGWGCEVHRVCDECGRLHGEISASSNRVGASTALKMIDPTAYTTSGGTTPCGFF